jgi:hypothetical protein
VPQVTIENPIINSPYDELRRAARAEIDEAK